jgi:tripeptide aminopeptidase
MPCSIASDAVGLFLRLAALVTPSGRERAAADLCLEYLRELGLDADEDDAGTRIAGDAGNIYTSLPATTEGTPIFLCAHLDTVPAVAPVEPVQSNGRITNAHDAILGADNKASVAGMLDAMRRVVDEGIPHAGIELVLTPQEEVGLLGVRAFDTGRLRARVGFVYDHAGPIGGIITRAPSQKSVRLEFTGAAAHAGIEPEKGRSAILAAARAISAMRLGRLDEGTTANVGTIQGGEARNVVPPRCTVHAEVRSLDQARCSEEAAAMVEAATVAAAETGCGVDVEVTELYRAYRVASSSAAYRLAQTALAAAGYPVYDVSTGGGADTHVFVERGLDCVNLCSGMEQIHTPHEYVDVDDVEGLSRLTLELIRASAAPLL